MKKLLLGLGSIAAVVAPIAAVVSCGSDDLNLGKPGSGSGDGTNTGGTGTTTTDTDPSTAGTAVADSAKVTKLKTDLIASGLVSGILASDITAVRSGNAFSYDDGMGTTVEAEASISFEITADTKSLTINGKTKPATTHVLTAAPVTLTILAQAERDDDTNELIAGGDKIDSLGYFFINEEGSKEMDEIKNDTNPGGIAIKNNIEDLFDVTGYTTPSTTGGSGAATVTPIDLTAKNGHATSTPWHTVFHNSGRSLPTVGDIFTVTVGGHALSYTWTAPDNTALAGFTANPHTKTQDDVVNYLAGKFVKTGVTADDVKTAFGITSASDPTSPLHHFTTGTTGTTTGGTVVTPTVDLSVELGKFIDATSSKDQATLVSAVGSKTTVTAAELGYVEPANLDSTLTAAYTIANGYTTGTLTVTVTLSGAATTGNTKTFVLTPKATAAPTATDLTSEIAKLTDVTSSLYDVALGTNTAATTSVVDATKLGITTPTNLASRLTASYAVKTPFAAGKAVITVTLTKDDGTAVTNNTKDITVTAKTFDFTAAKKLVTDATGLGIVELTKAGDVTLTGTLPVFTDGTTAVYSIAADAGAAGATVTVTATLSNPATSKTDATTTFDVTSASA